MFVCLFVSLGPPSPEQIETCQFYMSPSEDKAPYVFERCNQLIQEIHCCADMLEAKLLTIPWKTLFSCQRREQACQHLQTFVSGWGNVRPLRVGKPMDQCFMPQSAASSIFIKVIPHRDLCLCYQHKDVNLLVHSRSPHQPITRRKSLRKITVTHLSGGDLRPPFVRTSWKIFIVISWLWAT